MGAWQQARPTRIRIQWYEALLHEHQAQVRELGDFCALPFEPACLDHRQAQHSVRTPSASQIRQRLRAPEPMAPHDGHLLNRLRRGLRLPTIG